MILVVIRTRSAERSAEALRAAVGLGLRGDGVQVVLCSTPPDDPRVERALRTLDALGRSPIPATDLPAALRAASKVEVWT